MTRKMTDYIILIFCVILAVLLHRSTANYAEISQNSTGEYVRFLALSLGLLSAIQIFINFKKNDNTTVEFYRDKKRFFTLIILLVIYGLLISFFGFIISTALFLPLTMYLMGHREIKVIVLSSGGLLLFLQVLFVTILQVPLPKGIIFG